MKINQESCCLKSESSLKSSTSPTWKSKKNKKLSIHLSNCLQAVNELFQEKYAEPFLNKMDANKWNLIDFNIKVKRPIDLNIIRRNLKKFHYKHTEHFKKHIKFMVNSIYDNYPKSKLCQHAKFVEDFIDKRRKSYINQRMELLKKPHLDDGSPHHIKTDVLSSTEIKGIYDIKEEQNDNISKNTIPVKASESLNEDKNMLNISWKKPSLIKKLNSVVHKDANVNIQSLNIEKIPIASSGVVKKDKHQKRLDRLCNHSWNKTKKKDLQIKLSSLSSSKCLKVFMYLASIDDKYCEVDNNDKLHVKISWNYILVCW